jgi:hypothetical protein
MTVQQLIDALTAQVEADPYRKDASVVFGPEEGANVPLEGGIFAKQQETGLVSLILAPIKLNAVGGF